MFLTFSTSSFIPFDDTLNLNTVRKTTSDSLYNQKNLLKSNNQGTNLKNIKEIANSSQPKIWGGEVKNSKTGELDHQQKNLYTIGEIASFTNFQGSTKFIDSENYNALSILSNRENDNVLLNDGPQTNYEASMDPLPIAFKNPGSEGAGTLLSNRGVKGSIDFQDGLLSNKINKNTNNTSFSFLDEGESRFGNENNNGAVKIPGFTLNFGIESSKDFNPFTDKENLETILNDQFPHLSTTFVNSMLNLASGSRATEESLFRKTSGGSQNWYSHNSATKNTDSIAFGGLVRGS
jgi:hypothetical protein